MDLSEEQLERYRRQVSLPEIGPKGQARLASGKVLLTGVGGLGSSAALYLAGAGVGTLGLADGDVVEAVNLHRQVLYTTADLGKMKVDCAADRLLALNPESNVVKHPEHLTRDNATEIVREYDVVIDTCDNFPTRYLINDVCFFENKPYVHGSVYGFEGQVTVFVPGKGPCYRCLYPEPPLVGSASGPPGILGMAPGVIGTIEASEAVKLLLGIGTNLVGRVLIIDLLQAGFHDVTVGRNPDCPLCGRNPSITTIAEYRAT
jgi:molybdopterin/thiamine biosynthesis adenylyltransferase